MDGTWVFSALLGWVLVPGPVAVPPMPAPGSVAGPEVAGGEVGDAASHGLVWPGQEREPVFTFPAPSPEPRVEVEPSPELEVEPPAGAEQVTGTVTAEVRGTAWVHDAQVRSGGGQEVMGDAVLVTGSDIGAGSDRGNDALVPLEDGGQDGLFAAIGNRIVGAQRVGREKHADGLQAWGPTSRVLLRDNVIEWGNGPGQLVLLKTDLGPIEDVRIEGNVLRHGDGQNAPIKVEPGSAGKKPPTMVTVVGNVFAGESLLSWLDRGGAPIFSGLRSDPPNRDAAVFVRTEAERDAGIRDRVSLPNVHGDEKPADEWIVWSGNTREDTGAEVPPLPDQPGGGWASYG